MEDKKVKKATKRAAEMHWLGENESFLEEHYAGMWLAIEGNELVGVGPTLQAAAHEARSRGIDKPLFHAIRRKEFQGKIFVL